MPCKFLASGPQRPPGVLGGLLISVVLATAVAASRGAASRAFIPYASAKPILDKYRAQLPAELKNVDEAKWIAWARGKDSSIRARLRQGDLDSMVNMLLYGTSFTAQPRITMEGEGIANASRTGVLRARVDDLVAGLRSPGDNERLIFLQQVSENQGLDPGSS